METKEEKPSTLVAILKGRCPKCYIGKVSEGFMGMASECPHCGYKIHQESGYFLGAMMIGFAATSVLTIPPVILLKFMGYEDSVVLAYPFLQYAILGPLLIYYAKIIWVFVGYRAGEKMNRD